MIGCDCPVCRSSDPRLRRTRCSVLVQLPGGKLLIDTPPDLREQFLREGLSHADALLYTHAHADHVFGLDDVRPFAHRLGHDLPIYCNHEVELAIRQSFAYAFDPITQKYPAGGVPRLSFERIDGRPFIALGQQVVPIPLSHGRYNVLGFRFDTVAYCTDVNRIPESSWPLLEGVDTLVIDALRFEPHPTHFSVDEALAVIERLSPRKAYFTHISCRLDPEEAKRRLPSNVELAYDGLRFDF